MISIFNLEKQKYIIKKNPHTLIIEDSLGAVSEVTSCLDQFSFMFVTMSPMSVFHEFFGRTRWSHVAET